MKKLVVAISAFALIGSAQAKVNVKDALKAGSNVPAVAKEAGKTAKSLIDLGTTTAKQVPGLDKKVKEAKAAKSRQVKITKSVEVTGDLLPIMEKMARTMQGTSKTIGVIGDKVIKPFKKSVGKTMAEGGEKGAQAAKSLEQIIKTLRSVWPEIVKAVKQMEQQEKLKAKAKAKDPGLVPAA